MSLLLLLVPGVAALLPLLWLCRGMQSDTVHIVPRGFAVGAYLAAFFPAFFLGVVVGGTFGGSCATALAERLELDGRWPAYFGAAGGVSVVTMVLCAAAYGVTFILVRGIGLLAQKAKR